MSTEVVHDKYLGRKDIVLFASSVLSSLFPQPPTTSSKHRTRVSPLPEWLAYVLYRTMLPDSAVLHALELVRRLAGDFQCTSPTSAEPVDEPWDPSSAPELLHHRLLTACLSLAVNYWMDDAYSNKSWAVATRSYFTVPEIDDMQLSMLAALEFSIIDRAKGQTAESLVARWGADFAAWREDQEALRKERERRLSARNAPAHVGLRDAFKGKVCARQVNGQHASMPGLWVST